MKRTSIEILIPIAFLIGGFVGIGTMAILTTEADIACDHYCGEPTYEDEEVSGQWDDEVNLCTCTSKRGTITTTTVIADPFPKG